MPPASGWSARRIGPNGYPARGGFLPPVPLRGACEPAASWGGARDHDRNWSNCGRRAAGYRLSGSPEGKCAAPSAKAATGRSGFRAAPRFRSDDAAAILLFGADVQRPSHPYGCGYARDVRAVRPRGARIETSSPAKYFMASFVMICGDLHRSRFHDRSSRPHFSSGADPNHPTVEEKSRVWLWLVAVVTVT